MSSQPTSILIVDDEPTLRMVLRKSLSASGFRAEEAPSGEEALAVIRQRQFDLVLLDIEMPGLGGVEACREIGNFAPQTGIVIMSVRDAVSDVVDALTAGADDYVTKPFALRELVARLRAVHRRIRRPVGSVPASPMEGDPNVERDQTVLHGAGPWMPWLQKRSR